MSTALGRNWWIVVARGILAVLFGLYALCTPGLALASLIFVFGLMVLVAGILTIVAAVRRRAEDRPFAPLILEGIICIAFGLLALFKPGATALAWLYVVSGFAVVSGILHIAAGVSMRKEMHGEWTWVLNGVLTTIFGVLMILLPWAGLLSLVWLVGAYSLFFGALLISLAFKLRAHQARLGSLRPS